MKSGRSFFRCRHLALALIVMGSVHAFSDPETADLRGYGTVTADLSPTRAVFQCENPKKADILLDKLLADFFWDSTNPPSKSEIKVGTSTLTVYALPGQGAAVIARTGNRVVVLEAADNAAATAAADKESLLLGPDVTSQPQTTRPIYLDLFDNTSFESYANAMPLKSKFGPDSHWPFLKSFHGGETINLHTASFRGTNPAPNIMNWTAEDYEVAKAERASGLVTIKLWSGEAPLWAYNANPDAMMKVSDTTLLGEWGGPQMAGGHFPSWNTSLPMSRQPGLAFFLKAMQRYVGSPAVGGWSLEAGAPGDEYNFHDFATRSWDTSPAGQAWWRHWLRDVENYSLADLGTRWYGDAGHFTAWDQITVPDSNEFFGELGDDSFRIQNGWQIQGAAGLDVQPDMAKWVPVAMPPSQEQSFFPYSPANYFQTTFDPGDWWKEQKQKGARDVWLVLGGTGVGNNSAAVWWNDAPVPVPLDSASKQGPFAIRVTDLIKPGVNHLRIGLAKAYQTRAGKLAGPVFLTVHEPKRLPYLGHEANARCADLIEWKWWAMYNMVRNIYTYARKIDPDRSYIIGPGGGATGNADYVCQLASDFGVGTENSGREANYDPWWSGLGMVSGFYGTAELAGPPVKDPVRGDSLDRGFGYCLFDADANHSLYGDVESYIQREKDDGWFTRHHRQIELFGKFLRVPPSIVLLRAADNMRLSLQQPEWDIGRGEIQDAHYDQVYTTEREIKAGLINRYPALMDTGSEFLEPDTMAAIKKYVENGGTFIALQNTGRHTALDPDVYLAAKLAGFSVVNNNESGDIHFAADTPIFKKLAGKEIPGVGEFIDWVKTDDAKTGNVGLAATDPAAVPLARWSDGSVAIGYRKMGKGQIILLGSTFWRKGHDVAGVWETTSYQEIDYLEQLFTDCGVDHMTNASNPKVWTRQMVTKNGLQNWLVVFNRATATETADVWMAVDKKPDQVLDLQTGQPVSFHYAVDGFSIPDLKLAPYEVKFFAIKQPDMVGNLSVWWHEKTTYWKKTPAQIAASALVLPDLTQRGSEAALPLDSWQFTADPDNTISSQTDWQKVSYDDSQWKTVAQKPWNLADPKLADYHGTGLYRVTFIVPDDWQGRKILLSSYNWDTPIVYDHGDYFVNGTKVGAYDAHGWNQTYNYDITAQVHPGQNVLAVQVKGGKTFSGLGGVLWIDSWTPLADTIDLAGSWQAVQGDFLARVAATVPGTSTAKYLTRDITIPADWQGKNVYLQWSSKEQWLSSVVINGRPISFNSYGHPFGTWTRLNITPALKPGAVNTIELWPFVTMPDARVDVAKNCQLNEIEIGWK